MVKVMHTRAVISVC